MSHPLDNLDDDIREHLERETEENIARGMTPSEARAAARRKFGNVARAMEDTRAVWKWAGLEQFLQDARYGWRGLRRNPGFAVVVVLTLAVAIGLNTAVFSLVNAILIRPLPYPDPDRLLWVTNYSPMFKSEMVNGADYTYWKTQARSFEAMVAYGYNGSTITTSEGAEQHLAADVTSDFWKISGVRPAIGRLPFPGERDAAVLSDQLYEQQFHRDPHILGQTFVDHGDSFRVVGVLPKSFRSLLPHGINPFRALTNATEPELYLPNPAEWEPAPDLENSIELVVAKRKPGVSIEAARAEMKGIQGRVRQVHPDFYMPGQLLLTNLREKLVQNVRVGLLVLLAAVSFVLLIACVNVANLLLARGATRQKEIAIRAALGAGRGRVMRQFLGENLSLALLGGAGGLLFAQAAAPLIARLAAGSLPGFAEAHLDSRVVLFALAASLVTGILFSISPALFLRRTAPYEMLKQGGRTSSSGSAGLPVRRFLVAAELALTLVLVIGAGLMVKSFLRMNAHPAEFVPEKILTMKVSLAMPEYQDEAKQKSYWPELLRLVEGVPSVQAAGVVNAYVRGVVQSPDSAPLAAGQPPPGGAFYGISPGVTRILGLRLVKGRWLTDHESNLSIMVNESLAHEMFGNADPIGKRISIPAGRPGAGDNNGTIVGVAGDLKYSRLDEPPQAEIYIPYDRTPFLVNLTVMARTSVAASTMQPAVQKVISDIDRANPVYQVQTLEHALAESIAPRRFNLFLLGVLAGSALLLALIGIYGVMAYAVTQRRQEIGVRMALGAQRSQVVRLVVREGMKVAAAGIAAGLAAAFGLTRLMASLLYDVKTNDAATFAVVAVALALTALLACWRPAMRAAWVDPAATLREE